MGIKPGIKAAISGGGEAHTPVAPETEVGGPDQASFFGDPRPSEGGGNLVDGAKGSGRPPGATNKRTGKMSAWLSTLGFVHPGRFLAEIVAADTKELAEKLGCKPFEAMDVQRKAATDLLPYYESKMPVGITLPDGVIPVLNIGALDVTPRTQRGGGMSIDDPVQYQTLSDIEPVRSEGDPSHESTKPLIDRS